MAAFTQEQIEALSEILGRAVPPAYLAFMAAYPEDLLAATYPKLHDRPCEFELYSEPRLVLRLNAMVREEDIWTVEGLWDAGFLAIGQDIGGDVVALALDGAPEVHRLNTETAKYAKVADGLEAYAAVLLARCRAS